MKDNHMTWMAIGIAPIAVLAAGSYFFGWKSSNATTFIFIGTMVLCHLMMMRGHSHCDKRKKQS